MAGTQRWIRRFDEVGLNDVGLVGGKTASLGELRSALTGQIEVPDGFAITSHAFADIVEANGLGERIATVLRDTNWQDPATGSAASDGLRKLIERAKWPDGLADAIAAAYRALVGSSPGPVAVRSSASAEDLPGASFAGLHETVLGITAERGLMQAIRRCLSSLYTQRAINYRNEKGFPHETIALSVAVQRMVDAGRGASGVIFTLETESGCRDVVMVTGVLGYGETIVQGLADPDEFIVHKPTFRLGYRAVVRRRIGAKQLRMIHGARGMRTVAPSRVDRNAPCLGDNEVLQLAEQALAIEAHYSRRAGRDAPMDIEWAKDGSSGRLFILQARPETVHAAQAVGLKRFRMKEDAPVLATGQAVGESIAAGTVRMVLNRRDLARVRAGDVIVAESTTPDWEPVMRKAAAIITEHGGRTCHAAIIARELGIPAIVGVPRASRLLQDGVAVTVSCAEGDVGRIRSGLLDYAVETTALPARPPDGPSLYVNIADPAKAFRTASLPVDGVGLARIEFIIAEHIGIHPMALVRPEAVQSEYVRRKIARATAGYANGADYFVQKLAEGIGIIAAAFYPRKVIVRTSDFKSNEYGALLGGTDFETAEANPMIGFRGAARYVHPNYAPAFALECAALADVRHRMGLTNIVVMIPFCRRVEEAREVVQALERNGLKRGRDGLEIYAMAEIPSNAVLIDAFAAEFDGFSIGSNDLTQLTLGIDRDSAILAAGFSEEDPAVLRLISDVIAGAHRHGLRCGLCGQGPSDRPAFAEWLADQQIDSISLNPDSVPAYLARVASENAVASPAKLHANG